MPIRIHRVSLSYNPVEADATEIQQQNINNPHFFVNDTKDKN